MKQKIWNTWSMCKKTRCYGFMLPIILFFALSGCGQAEEYTEYNSKEAPPANIAAVELDVANIEAGESETPEAVTSAEAIESAFDISSLVLWEIVYRDGLIHIRDNNGRRGLLDGMGNFLVPIQRGVTFGGHSEERILVISNTGSGFMNTVTGEWVVPPTLSLGRQHTPSSGRPYSSAGIFRYGVAVVHLSDLGSGIINRDGEWVLEPEIGRSIGPQFRYGLTHYGPSYAVDFFINTKGERVFPLEHMEIYHRIHRANSNISVIDENLLKIRIGAYIGFFDLDGNEIVYFVDDEFENLLEIRIGAYIGFFDLDGNEIVYFVDDEFNWMDAFVRNGVIYAYYTDVLCQTWVDPTIQYRAFDMQGNEITNRYYTNMGGFSEGFASVQIGYPSYDWETAQSSDDLNWDSVFWGLIDKQGTEVIPTIHRYVSGVIHGRAQVLTTNGLALFNTAGEVVIPPGVYDSFTICDQGIIITGTSDASTLPSNQLQGLVDLDGNEIIPPRYNIIRNYWMSNPDRYSFLVALNHVGSWELPIAYPTFVEGRAAVAYDGLWGYIDMNGYEVIPLQFMYAGTFIDGMALVNIGGTRVCTQPHTRQSERDPIPFIRNYSAYGGTWHLIDLYGNIIETFEHEFMARLSANLLTFTEDVKKGIIRIVR